MSRIVYHDKNVNNHRRVTFYCPKCHNIINTFTLNSFSYAEVGVDEDVDEITDYNLDQLMLRSLGIIGNKGVNLKCRHCRRIVQSPAIDANILPIIKSLNDKCIETLYSCEGHIESYSTPTSAYIAFKDDVSNKFDMSNKLLKGWVIEEGPSTNKNIKMCLKFDISGLTIKQFNKKTYLINLLKYVQKYL